MTGLGSISPKQASWLKRGGLALLAGGVGAAALGGMKRIRAADISRTEQATNLPAGSLGYTKAGQRMRLRSFAKDNKVEGLYGWRRQGTWQAKLAPNYKSAMAYGVNRQTGQYAKSPL